MLPDRLTASDNVALRRLKPDDIDDFLALARRNVEQYYPWVSLPLTPPSFNRYLARLRRSDHEGFAIHLVGAETIIGMINLNSVIRKSCHSATLGYYLDAQFTGLGYMSNCLARVIDLAFHDLRLDLLKAHIQTDNLSSKRLVERHRFQRTSTSPVRLYINDRWRDHEYWTLERTQRPAVGPQYPPKLAPPHQPTEREHHL